jgi:hypothetical protein
MKFHNDTHSRFSIRHSKFSDENIDKFIDDMTKQHGSTFRLIDIKFAAAAKPYESTGDHAEINLNHRWDNEP